MTSTSTKTPVLIVGAGPSGLVLALTLARNNIPVRIIEKDTSFHIGQRGPGLQPRSLELMHFLGVLPDILKRALPVPMRCAYKMPEGVEPIAKFHFGGAPSDPTPDIPFPNALLLGQDGYERILREHLAKFNVHVELGMELIKVEQDDSGVTAKVVRHGHEAHSEETILVNWLVSAEGGRSTVRKQLGLDFLGETRDSLRLMLVDAQTQGISREYWHSWGDLGTRSVMLRPTEDQNLFSYIIAAPGPEIEQAMKSNEAFVELVHSISNRRDLRIGETKWKSDWRPNIRIVKEYRKERVFLIGDAAHIHPPTGGQGANTGMQDGFNLGWKLSLELKGLANTSLMDTYQEERHPVAKDVLARTTKSLERLVQDKHDGKKPPVAWDAMYRQLGINYRWSSIVVDEQPSLQSDGPDMPAYLPADNTDLRAGDRAPDATGLVALSSQTSTPISLFDIFAPTRHTILLFDPTAEQIEAANTTVSSSRIPKDLLHVIGILPSQHAPRFDLCGGNEVLVDTGSHAFSAYHPIQQGFHIFVVRPDGALGAILKNASGLQKYLQRVFAI
ncbi:monooxygenase [Cytidiella melzeri]|nr:monooxygenase [Cytidiella melzeri]